MRLGAMKIRICIGLLVLLLSTKAWCKNLTTTIAGTKQSDAAAAENLALPEVLNSENVEHIVAGVIVSVAAVSAGALLIEWLFVLYTAAARQRIASSAPSG